MAITGIAYGIRGFRQSFMKYLRLPSEDTARKGAKVLGVAGYAAKGTALLTVGVLIIIATVTAHRKSQPGSTAA